MSAPCRTPGPRWSPIPSTRPATRSRRFDVKWTPLPAWPASFQRRQPAPAGLARQARQRAVRLPVATKKAAEAAFPRTQCGRRSTIVRPAASSIHETRAPLPSKYDDAARSDDRYSATACALAKAASPAFLSPTGSRTARAGLVGPDLRRARLDALTRPGHRSQRRPFDVDRLDSRRGLSRYRRTTRPRRVGHGAPHPGEDRVWRPVKGSVSS